MNNNREIYELVMNKMCEQNAQSFSDGTCMYRAPHGLRCAVGHLIDDKAYSKNLECKTIDYISVQEAVTESCSRLGFVVDNSTFQLLGYMQQAHDSFCSSNRLKFKTYYKKQVDAKLKLHKFKI